MKTFKKVLTSILAATLVMTSLAACGSGGNDSTKAEEIYFLNFKPEIAEVYDKIAKDYETETGVKVNVVTAAAGTYEQTLKSEIAKADAPTIFQINGPVGYQHWKDYCADIKKSELYKHLTDKSLAVTSGDGVYAVPYVVEGYGIIYNNEIMDKYFALSTKKSKLKSAAEINNFAKLKEVVEDMTANKKELGIEGVFSSTSLAGGEQWRWQTHTANLPLYYEFNENKDYDNTVLSGLNAKEITFKYSDNYKNIFDLYLNNSAIEKGLLGSKGVSDSMAEFALGKSAMVQNGNWAWNDINKVSGNVVKPENIKYMPIYTGVSGEEKQGLCVGTENYLAINNKVSAEKQKASEDFLYWLFSSEKGKAYVKNELNFIAPFDTFKDNEKPEDPLAKEVLSWMEKKDVTSVPWTFAAFPSEDFKNYFGDGLLEYAQGGKSWDDVKKIVIDSWKSEREKNPVSE